MVRYATEAAIMEVVQTVVQEEEELASGASRADLDDVQVEIQT